MNHTSFVTAAYTVTFIGTVVLIVRSWLSMRRSEALAEDLRKRP